MNVDVKSKFDYTLSLSEQEYEDVYEFIECCQVPIDASLSSEEHARRAKKMMRALPVPRSRCKTWENS